MRNFIYILVCGVLFSCNNASDKEAELSSVPVIDNMEVVAEEVVGNEDAKVTSETFKYETILTQKTQELLDLKSLAQQFPEDTAVKEQLATITEALDISTIKGYEKVIAIEALAPLKRINDTVQHLQIAVSTQGAQGKILKDSITAVITTRLFIIDGIEQVGTKVVFKD